MKNLQAKYFTGENIPSSKWLIWLVCGGNPVIIIHAQYNNTFTLFFLLFFTQGLFELAGGLGFAVGPVIGGALYQLGGFRLPFLSVGGFVLLSVVPCFILIKSSGRLLEFDC